MVHERYGINGGLDRSRVRGRPSLSHSIHPRLKETAYNRNDQSFARLFVFSRAPAAPESG